MNIFNCICSDCERSIDVEDYEEYNSDDGTTVCCWAPVSYPNMTPEELENDSASVRR